MILRPDPHARDPASDLLLRVGGTRFELVTSSVSGRSVGCLGVPLNAPESTSPGRTLPPGAWGCLQDCREWLPPLAPALALWLPRSGTVDARTPPLGHDTTFHHGHCGSIALAQESLGCGGVPATGGHNPLSEPNLKAAIRILPGDGPRPGSMPSQRVIGCVTAAPRVRCRTNADSARSDAAQVAARVTDSKPVRCAVGAW